MTKQNEEFKGFPKEIRKLIKSLRSQGAIVQKTSSNHLRVVPSDPDKAIIVTGGTPSDHRSIANFKAALRRAGFKV